MMLDTTALDTTAERGSAVDAAVVFMVVSNEQLEAGDGGAAAQQHGLDVAGAERK